MHISPIRIQALILIREFLATCPVTNSVRAIGGDANLQLCSGIVTGCDLRFWHRVLRLVEVTSSARDNLFAVCPGTAQARLRFAERGRGSPVLARW